MGQSAYQQIYQSYFRSHIRSSIINNVIPTYASGWFIISLWLCETIISYLFSVGIMFIISFVALSFKYFASSTQVNWDADTHWWLLLVPIHRARISPFSTTKKRYVGCLCLPSRRYEVCISSEWSPASQLDPWKWLGASPVFGHGEVPGVGRRGGTGADSVGRSGGAGGACCWSWSHVWGPQMVKGWKEGEGVMEIYGNMLTWCSVTGMNPLVWSIPTVKTEVVNTFV